MARLITVAAVRVGDTVEVRTQPGMWLVTAAPASGLLTLAPAVGPGSVAWADDGSKVVLHRRQGRPVDRGMPVDGAKLHNWSQHA